MDTLIRSSLLPARREVGCLPCCPMCGGTRLADCGSFDPLPRLVVPERRFADEPLKVGDSRDFVLLPRGKPAGEEGARPMPLPPDQSGSLS